jgi:hypothetical protein
MTGFPEEPQQTVGPNARRRRGRKRISQQSEITTWLDLDRHKDTKKFQKSFGKGTKRRRSTFGIYIQTEGTTRLRPNKTTMERPRLSWDSQMQALTLLMMLIIIIML